MTTPNLYDPNVPELEDNSLAFSQPQIQNNLSKLYDAFKKNHVPLDGGSTAGNHTIIELLQQTGNPQVDINQIALFCKLLSGNTNQLCVRYEQNGTRLAYSCYQLYSVDSYNYFTFLPGNLIIYFGSFNTVAENKLPNNILTLKPPVILSVLGVSTCPIGQVDFIQKPVFTLILPPPNSPFSQVKFSSSVINENFPAPPSHYIIIASVFQGGI